MLRRRFLSFTSLVVFGSKARAQQDTTFKANVRVVNVLASVRDKRGAFVRDLTKDDFSLLENGRPQEIRYFTRETDLPLTVGLMVDTSMSQQRRLDAERGASFRFLDQVIREKDQAFIMQFDIGVLLSQELTSSRRQLQEALSYVDTPTRKELRAQDSGGTLLYDAVVSACRDVMMKCTGRKALIILSDGGENGSNHTLNDAVDAAQRSDTIAYSILFIDRAYQGIFGDLDGRGILSRLAKETGGEVYEVSKKESLDDIFGLIQDELRSQYSLGYVSDRPAMETELRHIQLTSVRPGLTVRARDRYWAKP